MDAWINNVIYMELHSGPKMANSTCGKTIVAGTIDHGSTVSHKLQGLSDIYYPWFHEHSQLLCEPVVPIFLNYVFDLIKYS